jgi:hypothetical protein
LDGLEADVGYGLTIGYEAILLAVLPGVIGPAESLFF